MKKRIFNSSFLIATLPYISLLMWLVPLLVFNAQQQSLIAHDEGIYAWRARWIAESGDWMNPAIVHYGKTPGVYWLIASSFSLFGISETTARLPSMVFSIISAFLIYEIGKIIVSKQVGCLAAAILSVEFFWLQYSRMSVPDIPLASFVLLGIWCLLKAELHPNNRLIWGFGVGLSFGFGFLIRSYMIFLPMVALMPYLIWEHRRHRHFTNPAIYLGFLLGLIPTTYWLFTSWAFYRTTEFTEMFDFIVHLNSEERNGNNIFYYLWNIPVKAFPWAFMGLIGLKIALSNPIPRYQLILVGFPVILFIEISLFSTRIPHYALSLYPFIALLAALGLDWLGKNYQTKSLPRILSYVVGGLSCLLLVASLITFTGVVISVDAEIQKYAAIAFVLGLGWLTVPLVWFGYHKLGKQFLTAKYWVAGWLVAPWLALSVAGITGLLGDFNPEVKAFLQQPNIASVVQNHPINFVEGGGKTGVLLRFYTPHLGKVAENISDLPKASYAWVKSDIANKSNLSYSAIATIRDVQLVQVQETANTSPQKPSSLGQGF
ncbi:MAG: glycosyltransferase family 39 protein [Chroococcus sp. CMT-3BRIN-NPC107]|jgi:4-amino-4-deoxy-L-arabinose transferase-like glycosyltransferase|nr:glycosyltransferase family 39 protein [Chroococcus sp. CMT-3BRIN-NPC107]